MNDKILRSVRQQQQSQITKLQSKSESDAEVWICKWLHWDLELSKFALEVLREEVWLVVCGYFTSLLVINTPPLGCGMLYARSLLGFVREYMKRRAEIELDYSRNLEKLNDRFANRKFRKSSTAKGQAVITAASVSDDTSSVSDSPRASTDERSGVGLASLNIVALRSLSGLYIRATYVAFATLVHESQELARSRWEIAQKIVSDITVVMKVKLFSSIPWSQADCAVSGFYERQRGYNKEGEVPTGPPQCAKQAYEKSAREAGSSRKKYEKPNSGLDALRNMVTRTDSDERTEKPKESIMTPIYPNFLRHATIPIFDNTFDERFYRMLSTTLTSYVEMERDFMETLSNSIEQLSETISKVDSGKDLESFLSSFDSLFESPGSYAFEPLYNDEENSLVVDEFTKVLLGQILLQLQERSERLKNEVAKKEKEIAGVRHMVEVYQNTPSFGNATNPMDLNSGTDGHRAHVEPVKKLQIAVVQDPSTNSPNNTIGRSQPSASNTSRAVAQFGYEAQADNELTVREKEELDVLGEDTDGWIKVRTTNGKEGYVPTSYIKIMAGGLRAPTAPKLAARSSVSAKSSLQTVKAVYDYDASDSSELSFRAGDTIEIIEAADASADAWWEGKLARTGRTGTFPVVFTQGWEEIAASLPPRSRRASVANSIMSAPGSTTDAIPKTRAIYSYEATCEGELSLAVLYKNTGSDAWWEGEGASGRGQFPVNYVQIIEEAGRPSVASRPAAAGGFKVKALHDFAASDKSELSFKAGDVIRITQSSDPDWWDGELNGRTGSLPKNYVERI
ncbi:hypothetical protein BJ742DRAFT_745660 [Cladochytrium replicatum]|nr:hypothetical protein BJ742DRAFT_745660 [Cladochytrium replicatum]